MCHPKRCAQNQGQPSTWAVGKQSDIFPFFFSEQPLDGHLNEPYTEKMETAIGISWMFVAGQVSQGEGK